MPPNKNPKLKIFALRINTKTHMHIRLQEAGVFTCLEGGTDKGRARKVR